MKTKSCWLVALFTIALLATGCSVTAQDVAVTSRASAEVALTTELATAEPSAAPVAASAEAPSIDDAPGAPTPTEIPKPVLAIAEPTVEPPAAVPADYDQRLNYYVYFMHWAPAPVGSTIERDFYRLHAGTGEATRLTNAASDGLGPFPMLDISPDQTMIAYIVDMPGGIRAVHVADITGGNARRITEVEDLRNIAWSTDGSEVLIAADNNQPAEPRWFMGAVDAASGSERVLLDSRNGKAQFLGTLDGFAYVVETQRGPTVHRLLRIDEQTGAEVASLDVEDDRWTLDADSGLAAAIGGGSFIDSVTLVDLTAADLAITEVAATSDSKTSPIASPDGSLIAYGAGGLFAEALGVVSIDGSQPTELAAAGDGLLTSLTWAPDSQSIVYSVGDFYLEAPMRVALVDGEIIDLGWKGRVLAVLPAD